MGPIWCAYSPGSVEGEFCCLHALPVVENANVREPLLLEPRISDTLSLAVRAEIALVGIGAILPEVSSRLQARCLDHEELSGLRAR